MRKYFTALLLPFLISCAAQNESANKEIKPEQIMVGGDSDAHGCKPSAGYTWSNGLKKCVRIWEEGKTLLNFGDNSKSQYIIIANDKNQYELFSPSVQNLMFEKNGKYWISSDDKYCLNVTMTEGDNKKPLLILSTKDKNVGCGYESLAFLEISSPIKTKP